MLQFYMTEYELDGEVFDGPLIMAASLEEANMQAKNLNLKLVGEMFPLANIAEQYNKTIH
jgi:hypothetical protein